MTDDKSTADDLTRIIVLVYAMLENSRPFWIFVAIRPSKYQPFLAAQKEGTLDIYNFAPYGEIIVSGEGKSPPEEVTLKVAEMYQTDPSVLFKTTDPEKEIETRMKAFEAAKKIKDGQ